MVGLCDDHNIDDIEDLTKAFNADGASNERSRKDLPPKAKRVKVGKYTATQHFGPVADSIIPGTQKIYVKTWGCSHNNSDGEYMAGQLASYGYQITGNSLYCIYDYGGSQRVHVQLTQRQQTVHAACIQAFFDDTMTKEVTDILINKQHIEKIQDQFL